jgi:hypothetical protein
VVVSLMKAQVKLSSDGGTSSAPHFSAHWKCQASQTHIEGGLHLGASLLGTCSAASGGGPADMWFDRDEGSPTQLQ